jgi:hypothetical protein
MIIILTLVKVVCKSFFSKCPSLVSIAFELNSQLHRIEESAFAFSGVTSSIIPASVELLYTACVVDTEGALLRNLFAPRCQSLLLHVQWEFVNVAAMAMLSKNRTLRDHTESLWQDISNQLTRIAHQSFLSVRSTRHPRCASP